MKKFALIVEGRGDLKSTSKLIGRIGAHFGVPACVVNNPIRAGEAKKLQRPGELEKFIKLGTSHHNVDEIIVILDLDDGCAATFHAEFLQRANAAKITASTVIHICFCVREYEVLFLADIQTIRAKLPDLGIAPDAVVSNPESIRGAKEALSKICKGRRYKETRDQIRISEIIDIDSLYKANRSFRKLVKSVTGKTYQELNLATSG